MSTDSSCLSNGGASNQSRRSDNQSGLLGGVTEVIALNMSIWRSRLRIASAVGLVSFFGAVLVLEGIRANLNPGDHTISDYSLGSFGWLIRVAFVTLGFGVLATALSLRLAFQASNSAAGGVALARGFGHRALPRCRI